MGVDNRNFDEAWKIKSTKKNQSLPEEGPTVTEHVIQVNAQA